MTSLLVKNLGCIRNQVTLFSNISFQLSSGEMLILEGGNGSGKSSLLRLLSGLSTPASGEIRWQDNLIQNIPHEYHQDLHYIGHESASKSHLTVSENLQLTQCISMSSSSLIEVLESLQLSPFKNVLAKNLSAGQKRRLALAKLFLIPRKLWLLDEPLTALDTSTQAFFLTELENHLQNDGMAIMSTHQPLRVDHAKSHTIYLPH